MAGKLNFDEIVKSEYSGLIYVWNDKSNIIKIYVYSQTFIWPVVPNQIISGEGPLGRRSG